MTSWFRSWHGAPTDNKWLVIARRANVKPGIVSAVAWALFDYASQGTERGNVAGFDVETYATFSGFDECEVSAVIEAMREKGTIDCDHRLAAWDRRQPKREDDSAERVRRYRQRNSESVTQCNAESRNETHVTHTESDPESDPDKESISITNMVGPSEFTATDGQTNGKLESIPPVAIERTDADLTKAVAAKLESVGVALTQYMVDTYVATAMEHGIHATLAGITAAADQGKQQKMNYVLACIRSKAGGDERKVVAGIGAGASANEERLKLQADAKAAQQRIKTNERLGVKATQRDLDILARWQKVGAH